MKEYNVIVPMIDFDEEDSGMQKLKLKMAMWKIVKDQRRLLLYEAMDRCSTVCCALTEEEVVKLCKLGC